MDADVQNTLVFLAVVITALLLAQTIILLLFVVAFRAWSKRVGTAVEEAVRTAEPALQSARDLLVESKEKLNLISSNLLEISQVSKTQIARLDSFLTETTERACVQIDRLEEMVTSTIARVEETTEIVQRNVLKPIREISAVATGVRAAVDHLFNRRKAGVERATQDEELFI